MGYTLYNHVNALCVLLPDPVDWPITPPFTTSTYGTQERHYTQIQYRTNHKQHIYLTPGIDIWDINTITKQFTIHIYGKHFSQFWNQLILLGVKMKEWMIYQTI